MSMTREHQLAEAFAEAADTLVDDFDVIDFLHTMSERCVQLLAVDAAGFMLADSHGRLRVAASSSANACLSALFRLQRDAGPCLDTYRTGTPVIDADLQICAERWPQIADAAGLAGFVSVHALPMRLRANAIGALNLFSTRTGPLGEHHARAAQALADTATIGILAQRHRHQAGLLNDQLQQALASRVTIEQATGVLAERCRISIDAAFALLRAYARSRNLPLSELARDVAKRYAAADEVMVGPAQDGGATREVGSA
jgi:hypothetical protein